VSVSAVPDFTNEPSLNHSIEYEGARLAEVENPEFKV
jgi:hypothetical protein